MLQQLQCRVTLEPTILHLCLSSRVKVQTVIHGYVTAAVWQMCDPLVNSLQCHDDWYGFGVIIQYLIRFAFGITDRCERRIVCQQ